MVHDRGFGRVEEHCKVRLEEVLVWKRITIQRPHQALPDCCFWNNTKLSYTIMEWILSFPVLS